MTMWPFRKDKNESLRNCLNISRKNLVTVGQDLISDKPTDMKIDIARVRVARFINAIDMILKNLK